MSAILFMAFFGLGTMPLMWSLSFFGLQISLSTRNKMKKIIPYAIMLTGALLILRGMNLNVPYISPAINYTSAQTVSCP